MNMKLLREMVYYCIYEEYNQSKALKYINERNSDKRLMKNVIRREDIIECFGKSYNEVYQRVWTHLTDCEGVIPVRNGYEYKNKLYDNVRDAHLEKLKDEYPYIISSVLPTSRDHG